MEPPFMLEVARYEWVELVPDTSEEELQTTLEVLDVSLDGVYRISSLVRSLCYRYPVAMILPSHHPCTPSESGMHLVVYRNR